VLGFAMRNNYLCAAFGEGGFIRKINHGESEYSHGGFTLGTSGLAQWR